MVELHAHSLGNTQSEDNGSRWVNEQYHKALLVEFAKPPFAHALHENHHLNEFVEGDPHFDDHLIFSK